MHLILLPGMDGGGELFYPLKPYLNGDYTVIPLAQSGAQDYATLTAQIERQLPDEPFVLLAESFSGPIAARLAQRHLENLRGVIFVVTFLSPLSRWVLSVADALPLKKLLQLPLSSLAIRTLFLGNAEEELLRHFRRVVDEVPEAVLHGRIQAIKALEGTALPCELPALYIQARGDRLVPEAKWLEFEQRFSNISRTSLVGPHCILQHRPEESAAAIMRFIEGLSEVG